MSQQRQQVLPYNGYMTAAHTYELPPRDAGGFQLPDAEVEAVEQNGEVVYLTRSGRPVARIVPVDPEQAWFWTSEWQAKEREADQSIAAGRVRRFGDDQDFLASLEGSIETGRL